MPRRLRARLMPSMLSPRTVAHEPLRIQASVVITSAVEGRADRSGDQPLDVAQAKPQGAAGAEELDDREATLVRPAVECLGRHTEQGRGLVYVEEAIGRQKVRRAPTHCHDL